MTTPIITLLSDFGLKDPYVVEMKAVILTINPEARIIDINHSIEKFNIKMGAFMLASATRYFPKGTIHVAVVDPSVGTKRRDLLVETHRAFYIGPDNGILMLAAQREGIRHVYRITNSKFMLPDVSFTFHGRDVFAPAAAHLAKGTEPTNFGQETKKYLVPEFAKPDVKMTALYAEVLHIDDFGNIITNVSKEDLEKTGIRKNSRLQVKIGRKAIRTKFCSAYGEAPEKTPLVLLGSHNFLEVAVNQGNAAKKFNARIGDTITVSSE